MDAFALDWQVVDEGPMDDLWGCAGPVTVTDRTRVQVCSWSDHCSASGAAICASHGDTNDDSAEQRADGEGQAVPGHC